MSATNSEDSQESEPAFVAYGKYAANDSKHFPGNCDRGGVSEDIPGRG